jgi:hypothetical protein
VMHSLGHSVICPSSDSSDGFSIRLPRALIIDDQFGSR